MMHPMSKPRSAARLAVLLAVATALLALFAGAARVWATSGDAAGRADTIDIPTPEGVTLSKGIVQKTEGGLQVVTRTVAFGDEPIHFAISATNHLTTPVMLMVRDRMPAGLRAEAANAGACPAAVIDGGRAAMFLVGLPAGGSRLMTVRASLTGAASSELVLTNQAEGVARGPATDLLPVSGAAKGGQGADAAAGCGAIDPRWLNPDLFPANPPIVSNSVQVVVQWPDLGDAPDSTNHNGQIMRAYPGTAIQADFPTVFDPAIGLPSGPRHRYAQPLHLGNLVSAEDEADIGPDADGVNNIRPLAPPNGLSNRDRHDDGVLPPGPILVDCQPTLLTVRVSISPQAVQHFAQAGTVARLNVWLDSNRDGDWADAGNCGAGRAREHIVIDHPVNVMALGPGVHPVPVPTGRVYWPAALSGRPAWLRVTLSDAPAPKPFTDGDGVAFGDGRGPVGGYLLGETEDYLYAGPGALDASPDVQAEIEVAAPEIRPGADSAIAMADSVPTESLSLNFTKMVVRLRNDGNAPAVDGLLQFEIQMLNGCSAYGINIDRMRSTRPELTGQPSISGCSASVPISRLEPNGIIAILIGLTKPITPPINTQITLNAWATFPDLAPMADVPASAPAAPTATRTFGWNLKPVVTHPRSGTTNGGTVAFRGYALPNSSVTLTLVDHYLGDPATHEVMTNSQGRFEKVIELTTGNFSWGAEYSGGPKMAALAASEPSASGQLTVDPSLPWNPLSLTIVDPQGRFFHPASAAGRLDTQGWVAALKPGQTYGIWLEAPACSAVQMSLDGEQTWASLVPVKFKGRDGYGKAFLVPATGIPSLKLRGTCGGPTDLGGGTVTLWDPEGDVTDAATGSLLAGVQVAALVGEPEAADGSGAGAGTAFSLWPAGEYDQINPQTTAADGHFSFFTPSGLYRLLARKLGYQSYRSADILVVDKPVRYDVPLTPAISQDAAYLVQITPDGFDPPVLRAPIGSVVEFISLDPRGRRVTTVAPATAAGLSAGGMTFDSGQLLLGESYKVRLAGLGQVAYEDAAIAGAHGWIEVAPRTVYLPLVVR